MKTFCGPPSIFVRVQLPLLSIAFGVALHGYVTVTFAALEVPVQDAEPVLADGLTLKGSTCPLNVCVGTLNAVTAVHPEIDTGSPALISMTWKPSDGGPLRQS